MTKDKAEIAERLRDEFESLWFLYPEETFEAQFSGAWSRVRQAVDDAVEALSAPEFDPNERVKMPVKTVSVCRPRIARVVRATLRPPRDDEESTR